ncbi:hypothetical protein DSO57_1008774 [Entomophthora muscae]|uniref:Uncharacterized protein n=1 Tax=Entomophthora muscae TaxID=34485 RepID=A0ACC2UGW9_9FUNG|nr:hypothetical protein DSO57_1008774 [Entomophthora muscae]
MPPPPENFAACPDTLPAFDEPPSTPSPPPLSRPTVQDSCWNPEHPNPFVVLDLVEPQHLPSVGNSHWNPGHPNPFSGAKEPLEFDHPIIADDDPLYNHVTVETAPNSPQSQPIIYDDTLELPTETLQTNQ